MFMKNRVMLWIALWFSILLVGVGIYYLRGYENVSVEHWPRTLNERVYWEEDMRHDWKKIVENYDDVIEGMSEEEVMVILGEPNQKHELYEPVIKNPKITGKSWFYMKRPREEGRGDAEVVVRFDLGGKVIKVDTWGVEND